MFRKNRSVCGLIVPPSTVDLSYWQRSADKRTKLVIREDKLSNNKITEGARVMININFDLYKSIAEARMEHNFKWKAINGRLIEEGKLLGGFLNLMSR